MTPFGARLRALREERGITLKQLAGALQVSAAYLSALEHGKRGAPSAGLVFQVNEFFGLIWDDAEELAALARLSNPRVTVNTAGVFEPVAPSLTGAVGPVSVAVGVVGGGGVTPNSGSRVAVLTTVRVLAALLSR